MYEEDEPQHSEPIPVGVPVESEKMDAKLTAGVPNSSAPHAPSAPPAPGRPVVSLTDFLIYPLHI